MRKKNIKFAYMQKKVYLCRLKMEDANLYEK